jgi:hypothetical protein
MTAGSRQQTVDGRQQRKDIYADSRRQISDRQTDHGSDIIRWRIARIEVFPQLFLNDSR